MSTVIPFGQQSFPLILITKKGVNLSSCVLAKPNQLLSIIICLFKRFLIKPEDLFDLSGFGSAQAKHAHLSNTREGFGINIDPTPRV
jgi:hypothetical protein